MKALWIFLILIVFCIYVLIGLHITEGLESGVQVVLSWVIYTLMCTTFLNVFILGYFWSVIREKKGPTGLRGPSGENGKIGLKGSCSIDATEAFLIKSLNEYIDGLYFSKTNKHIVNDDTQKFPCKYLNNKISVMAGSNQYKILVANLAKDNKPVNNIINYIKNIWSKWFELIYNSTNTLGEWFEDKYADEEYEWSQNNNPFDEIKKYDIYYWGVTRDFRPLKAEICRSSSSYKNSKLPLPNVALEPRLKIIDTNDYGFDADDRGTGIKEDANFWYPLTQTIGVETYYPVGHIIRSNHSKEKQFNKTIVGYSEWSGGKGPFMKTILVSGDVVKPLGFPKIKDFGGANWINVHRPLCPTGYVGLGDVFANRYTLSGNLDDIRCVPEECTEDITKKTAHRLKYPWRGSSSLSLTREGEDTNEALGDNAYNLFRTNLSGKNDFKFYKIKDSCLIAPEKKSVNKDIEPENGDLGIGWNGHPYKLDPKYSIFTFLDLVPEGMIVNKGTGRRFYIIHYGGEDGNMYIILDLNEKTEKYDIALQVEDTTKSSQSSSTSLVVSRTISRDDNRQQWVIILGSDKKHFTLKNVINNKYLYLGVEPQYGITQFSTIDLDNNNYKNNPVFSQLNQDDINNGTLFTFIPSFGTNLNIIDK